jgi:hypothetical protein
LRFTPISSTFCPWAKKFQRLGSTGTDLSPPFYSSNLLMCNCIDSTDADGFEPPDKTSTRRNRLACTRATELGMKTEFFLSRLSFRSNLLTYKHKTHVVDSVDGSIYRTSDLDFSIEGVSLHPLGRGRGKLGKDRATVFWLHCRALSSLRLGRPQERCPVFSLFTLFSYLFIYICCSAKWQGCMWMSLIAPVAVRNAAQCTSPKPQSVWTLFYELTGVREVLCNGIGIRSRKCTCS